MAKIILEILSFLTSAVAILLSYRTYLRQKTFENENHLFRYNIEKYHEILDCLSKVFPVIEDSIDKFTDEATKSTPNKNLIEAIDDRFGYGIENLKMEIFAKSAFVPESVFEKIKEFAKQIPDIDFLEDFGVKTYKQKFQQIDLLEHKFFAVGEAMRENLGIRLLNEKLESRLFSRKRIERKEKQIT